MELFRSSAYDSLEEGYWALFRKRWELQTGTPLIVDRTDRDLPCAGDGEIDCHATQRPILGYGSRFSVANGESIEFKVSAKLPGPYQAMIQRIRSGDRTYSGFKTTRVDTPANTQHPGRLQGIETGSLVETKDQRGFSPKSFTLVAYVWPTLPSKGRQALLGAWDETASRGYGLELDNNGAVALILGDGERRERVSTGVPLMDRHWYVVAGSFDAVHGKLWVAQKSMLRCARDDRTAGQTGTASIEPAAGVRFHMAAWSCRGVGGYYNGKIDSPAIASRALISSKG